MVRIEQEDFEIIDSDAFRIPLMMQDSVDAKAGPELADGVVYPGDIFRATDGYRVITKTQVSPKAGGVEVLNPTTDRKREYPLNAEQILEGWTRVRRGISMASTVIERDGDHYDDLLTGFITKDSQYNSFICEFGKAPIGGMSVTLDTRVSCGTLSELREVLTVASTNADLLPHYNIPQTAVEDLTTTLESDIRKVAEQRFEAVDQSYNPTEFWTTAVIPPLPEPDSIKTVDGITVSPGDKIISAPVSGAESVLYASPAELAQGSCEVVVDGEHELPCSQAVSGSDGGKYYRMYDILEGAETRLTPETLRQRLGNSAGRAPVAHLQLLGRNAEVMGIDAETVSLHAYRCVQPNGPVFILAIDHHYTNSPRLEHPLVMDFETYSDADSLVSGVRACVADLPVDSWAVPKERLQQTCDTLANNISKILDERLARV